MSPAGEGSERMQFLTLNKAVCWGASQKIFLGTLCPYCGVVMGRKSFSIDHVIPKQAGVRGLPFNTMACCKNCNSEKKDAEPLEFIMRKCRRLKDGEKRIEHLSVMAGCEVTYDGKLHRFKHNGIILHACAGPRDAAKIARGIRIGLMLNKRNVVASADRVSAKIKIS